MRRESICLKSGVKGTGMRKKVLGDGFDPERYSMIFCPECNGRGKIFKDIKEFEVCMVCGGFGLIKTPREEPTDGRNDGGRFND
jgi:DnaJ-class molecular chaperone